MLLNKKEITQSYTVYVKLLSIFINTCLELLKNKLKFVYYLNLNLSWFYLQH